VLSRREFLGVAAALLGAVGIGVGHKKRRNANPRPTVVKAGVTMGHQDVRVHPVNEGITHGEQISLSNVGPWTLQGVAKGSESLSTLTSTQLSERISNYSGWGRPSYIPGSDYVYDNNPSNHGGVVPAGGMMIDGYFVAAGTWVAQFYDCSASGVIIEGDGSGAYSAFPGVMFRGCRMRGPYAAPGWLNQNGYNPGGPMWIVYCDIGAVSTAQADKCEVALASNTYSTSSTPGHLYVIRCYISNTTTHVFLNISGDAAIENLCGAVTDFGYGSTYHLNGIANSGAQTATLWLRNNAVLSQQSGSTQLTDVIQFAADDGAYLGGGTNLDGSSGYWVKDNYLGGAAYTLQLGYDKANTVDDVKHVHVVGNKFTTSLYANSGESGLAYKVPDFTNTLGAGGQGNEWSGNTWADGPNAGQTITAPPASN
jgi:hypothetical protein